MQMFISQQAQKKAILFTEIYLASRVGPRYLEGGCLVQCKLDLPALPLNIFQHSCPNISTEWESGSVLDVHNINYLDWISIFQMIGH